MNNVLVSTELALDRSTSRFTDYVDLTKPRLNALVIVTTAAGYYLGASNDGQLWAMVSVALGTALVAAGSAALNQWYERDADALMRRTRRRPLPDGRLPPADALCFGVALAVAGLTVLAVVTNTLAVTIAFTTLLVYVAAYTPLKRRTSAAVLVGAVPVALPPLIGWAAAHGSLSPGGWALVALVFFWQIPHFTAIAWLHRDDYRNAGFPFRAAFEPDSHRVGREALIFAALLVTASMLPALAGISGGIYVAVALTLGAGLIALTVRFAVARNEWAARALFVGSIVYLPLVWAALIADRM